MEVKQEVMRCAQDNTYSFVHFHSHFNSHFHSHFNSHFNSHFYFTIIPPYFFTITK